MRDFLKLVIHVFPFLHVRSSFPQQNCSLLYFVELLHFFVSFLCIISTQISISILHDSQICLGKNYVNFLNCCRYTKKPVQIFYYRQSIRGLFVKQYSISKLLLQFLLQVQALPIAAFQ